MTRGLGVTFAGRTPVLKFVAADGASASTDIAVTGIASADIPVAVLNLTDSSVADVASHSAGTVQIASDTSGDSLVVVFWSSGLGGQVSS